MQTKSLGFKTDLMLAAFDGEVSRGDGYIAARTPSCPQFWWGNFVLFSEPPRPGEVGRWEAIFDQEVGRVPGVAHRNLAWDVIDGSQGDSKSFVEKGYTLTEDFFLETATPTESAHCRDDLQVRPLNSDVDWRDALAIEQQSFDDSPSFQQFLSQQMSRNRAVVARGVGLWFGTFSGGEMVATMGLFVQDGLGRCQGVATAPGHRRQGCCSTMVHAVCSYGFAHMGLERIVIMTTPGSAAARVYESVGFTLRERVSSLSISPA